MTQLFLAGEDRNLQESVPSESDDHWQGKFGEIQNTKEKGYLTNINNQFMNVVLTLRRTPVTTTPEVTTPSARSRSRSLWTGSRGSQTTHPASRWGSLCLVMMIY